MNPIIEHNFKYHAPRGTAVFAHEAIRAKAKELAHLIDQTLPASAAREKASAITKCEEAMMHACAGVARHWAGIEPVTASAVADHVEARLAVSALAVELGANNALPSDIQWMPPGRHSITARQGSEIKTMEIIVNARTAEVIQNSFKELSAKAAAGLGDAPYFDFNHDDKEASARPTEFYWAGEDPKNGGVRAKVEWTEPGKAAVLGKAYRRFSPSFLPNANGEVIAAPVNMGGLVNRAAFKTIQPLFTKEADQPQQTVINMDPKTGTPTDLNGAVAMIAALRAQLADSENAKTVAAKDGEIAKLKIKITELENSAKEQSKVNAKAAVAAAVAAGKIEPKNADLQKHYEEMFVASPVAAKAIIDALPVNAALATVVAGGSQSGPAASASGEHQFIVKAKALAAEKKIDFTAATVEIAAKEPTLYQEYNKSLSVK